MNDCAVRGVPSAYFVPGLPRSSSMSLDQSTVSWTDPGARITGKGKVRARDM